MLILVNLQVMNMLSLMVRLPYTYLMISTLFVSVHGRGADLGPSCEVELIIRRGTTMKRAPWKPVTVSCPVKHCGKSLNVTWCKLLDARNCERINETENVEVTQEDNHVELISTLTFKHISLDDDGLYRCELRGDKHEYSHIVNISVSDMHQVDETIYHSDITKTVSPASPDESLTWLPYLCICVGITVIVLILTVLTMAPSCWRDTLTFKPTKRQGTSSHMIPDLPKWSAPSTPVLQSHFILNDIYFSSTAGTPASPQTHITDQPVANAGDNSWASDCAVYSVIAHIQSGKPAIKHQAATQQDKRAEYSSVKVS